MPLFSKPVPWKEAMRDRKVRQLLPTTLSTREYQQLGQEVLRRAVISAKVTNANFLQRLNDLVFRIVGGPTEADERRRDEGLAPLLVDIPQARLQLKQYLDSISYRAAEGEEGTLKDLRSDVRLNTTINTNVDMAANYGNYVAGQDDAILDLWPAQELFRLIDSREKRDWRRRWLMAGGQLYNERMIALKNAEVWNRLGDPALFDDGIHNPYPPFAFNSGMDVRDVSREDAISLGVMRADDPAPSPNDIRLNDDLQYESKQFAGALQNVLANDPDLKLTEIGTLTLA